MLKTVQRGKENKKRIDNEYDAILCADPTFVRIDLIRFNNFCGTNRSQRENKTVKYYFKYFCQCPDSQATFFHCQFNGRTYSINEQSFGNGIPISLVPIENAVF